MIMIMMGPIGPGALVGPGARAKTSRTARASESFLE